MKACKWFFVNQIRLSSLFIIVSCQLLVSPVVSTLDVGEETGVLPQKTTSKVHRNVSSGEPVTTLVPQTGRRHEATETTPQSALQLTTERRININERTIAYEEFEEQTPTDIMNPSSDGAEMSSNDRATFQQTERVSNENASNFFNENNTRETPPNPVVEKWAIVLDRCQLALTCVGYVANKVTFITLLKNGHMFSPAICLLLKHQALLDSWVSAMGTILLLQPPLWKIGHYNFDLVVCYVWHSQAIYWATIYMSVWNLVAIAVERYIAVCHPFKHNDFQGTPVRVVLASMYVASVVILFPSYIQVRFEDNMCISEYLIPGKLGEDFFYGYSILCLFTLYLLPALAFMFLYGRIIASLRQRKKSSQSGTSKALKTVQTTITKTAFVVTLVFMITIGFDAWSYTLGYTGVTNYEFGTPVQKIGVFFAVCNSVINPFVYLVFMPAFRDSLAKTFCCRTLSDGNSNNSVTQSSDANCV